MMFIPLVVANARITDFSHANYIPVLDGDVLVFEQRDLLKHSSNLSEYASMIDETQNLSESLSHSHMRKLLEVDTDHLRTLLSVLKVHHRIARSLDFLGTALKVVAGTPDATDLFKIKITEAQLVESNSRQIAINSETQKQINKLTDTINKVINARKGDLVDTPHLYEALLARNRMLSTEIQNLILTITLAKSNIINPTILDHADLKPLVEQDTPIVSLIEASKIRVLQSENSIHILIAYPRVKFSCKKVAVYPVSHQHTILRLDEDTLAECEHDTFAVTGCTDTTHFTFCERSRRETCVRSLHAGNAAQCHTQPSHLREINPVDDGVVIINEAAAHVSTDGSPETLIEGTYLVTFERTATINGSEFVNLRKTLSKQPGIVRSPLLNIVGHDPVLSIPLLHRMSNENLHSIQNLMDDVESEGSPRLWFVAGVVLNFGLIGSLALYLALRRRRASREIQRTIDTFNMTEDGHKLEGGVVNN
uniref:Env n=1 Tax=Drosophila melanogaster TaxID=7227 RepID=A5YVH8_DROME|nr:env [Drosophila melanogaster]